jgi:metal-dependent amidase/aminoacylase/carboxypeptidase family protein
MPRELADLARDRDELVDAELDEMIPTAERPYNVKTLDALARAVQRVAKMFGIEAELEEYTEPSVRLDDDVARFLMMMSTAAEDYGKPFPVQVSELKGDKELTLVTAHLMELAADEDFKRFLEGDDERAEVEIEIRRDGDEMERESFDFGSRMR